MEARDSGVRVRLVTHQPTDCALLLAAAVRCLRPVPTGDLGPMRTFTTGLPASAASLAGELRDVLREDEHRDRHVRRSDVLLVAEGEAPSVPERESTVRVGAEVWVRDGREFEVSVDPTIHRPVGRRSTGDPVVASATVDAGAVIVTWPTGSVTVRGAPSQSDVIALRDVRALVADGLPPQVERPLLASGLVIAAPGRALPAADDDLSWQAWSVHERRHALRQFGPTAALDAWPSVTVILVTHRPDHLDHAIAQLAGLRYPRLEVVIGAHGDRVDGARLWDLAQQVPYPVSIVPIDGRRTLGEALQACTDRAEGALVTKMDDDDFYGPEHVWDLVLARQYSGAQVVGKALDWVYLESQDSTVFRPTYPAEKYADFVAGGTMLISAADLGAVGGWRPVPKSVDRALLDRVLADGGLVYRTHGLGYVYVRHSAGHTASVTDEHFLTKTTAIVPGLVRHECFGTAEAGVT